MFFLISIAIHYMLGIKKGVVVIDNQINLADDWYNCVCIISVNTCGLVARAVFTIIKLIS